MRVRIRNAVRAGSDLPLLLAAPLLAFAAVWGGWLALKLPPAGTARLWTAPAMALIVGWLEGTAWSVCLGLGERTPRGLSFRALKQYLEVLVLGVLIFAAALLVTSPLIGVVYLVSG